VDDLAVDIDQINLASATLRREQRKARKRAIVIESTQSDSGSFAFDLFNNCRYLLAFLLSIEN